MGRMTKLQRSRFAAIREQLTDTTERLDVANANAARWYADRDHARDERNDALEELCREREAAATARTEVKTLNNVVARMFSAEAVRSLLGRCVSPDLVPVFGPCETARDFDLVLKSLDVFKAAVESNEAADVAALIEAGNMKSEPQTVESAHRIFLTSVGENVIGAIKAVREVSGGLRLKEAKDLVDAVRGVLSDYGSPPVPGSPREIPAPDDGAYTTEQYQRAAATLAAAGCGFERRSA